MTGQEQWSFLAAWPNLCWSAGTVLGVFLIWQYVIRTKIIKVERWEDLLLRYIAILGWMFLMYVSVYDLLLPSGLTVWAMLAPALFMFGASLAVLLSNHEVWERVVSGVTVALVAFGLVFALFAEPVGLSVLMGALIGVLLGQSIAGTMILAGLFKLPERHESSSDVSSKYTVERI